MLKILVGVGLGFLIFTNPEARQITADLLCAAGDALAPAEQGKTLQDRVKDAVGSTSRRPMGKEVETSLKFTTPSQSLSVNSVKRFD